MKKIVNEQMEKFIGKTIQFYKNANETIPYLGPFKITKIGKTPSNYIVISMKDLRQKPISGEFAVSVRCVPGKNYKDIKIDDKFNGKFMDVSFMDRLTGVHDETIYNKKFINDLAPFCQRPEIKVDYALNSSTESPKGMTEGKKVLRLTERDLTILVNKILSEQEHSIPKTHPVNNPLWKKMLSDVDGEGVEVIKYTPNKMLVINAFGKKYTITIG